MFTAMHIEVAAVEDRARRAGLPMFRVFKAAGVNYTTWWRWKKNDTAPNLATLDKVRQALDSLERQAA